MKLSKQLANLQDVGIALDDADAGFRALLDAHSPEDYASEPYLKLLVVMATQRLSSGVVLITRHAESLPKWRRELLIGMGPKGESFQSLPAALTRLTGVETRLERLPKKKRETWAMVAMVDGAAGPIPLRKDDALDHLLEAVQSHIPTRPSRGLCVGTPGVRQRFPGRLGDARFLACGGARDLNTLTAPEVEWTAVVAPQRVIAAERPGALSLATGEGVAGAVSLARPDGNDPARDASATQRQDPGPTEVFGWWGKAFTGLVPFMVAGGSVLVSVVYLRRLLDSELLAVKPMAPWEWGVATVAFYGVLALILNVRSSVKRDRLTLRVRRCLIPHFGFRWFTVQRADIVSAYVEGVVVGGKTPHLFHRVRVVTRDRKDRVVSHLFGQKTQAESLAAFVEGR